MDKLIFKSYHDLVDDIKSQMDKFSSRNFDLVVGIPRSGMIPAYFVSAFLNIDCCDVDSLINNNKLQKGITRTTKANINYPHEAKSILLLDDSVYSGKSLEKILKKIPSEINDKLTTCVVYATGLGKNKVDFYLFELDGLKLFEWGLYHNNILNKTCFDMDGVICRDCTEDENDDGDKYINFIKNAEPLFLPTKKVHSIITNRLEKYRKETEIWLEKHNVSFDNLIMLKLKSKDERTKIDPSIEHKAKLYKNFKDSILFIESSLNQSENIAKYSGKPVYCVEINKLIDPDLQSKLFYNSTGLFKSKYLHFKHKIKTLLIKLNLYN